MYKCLVQYMNYVTRCANLDGTVDKTTWGFGGFMGDCGHRLINKPVSKGGQIVMMYDMPHTYVTGYWRFMYVLQYHHIVSQFLRIVSSEKTIFFVETVFPLRNNFYVI